MVSGSLRRSSHPCGFRRIGRLPGSQRTCDPARLGAAWTPTIRILWTIVIPGVIKPAHFLTRTGHSPQIFQSRTTTVWRLHWKLHRSESLTRARRLPAIGQRMTKARQRPCRACVFHDPLLAVSKRASDAFVWSRHNSPVKLIPGYSTAHTHWLLLSISNNNDTRL